MFVSYVRYPSNMGLLLNLALAHAVLRFAHSIYMQALQEESPGACQRSRYGTY